MFCPKCGTGNADGAAFCVGCGAPLQQTPQDQQQQNNYGYQQPAAPQPPKKNKKTMAIVISVAAVLVAAAIAVILVLTLGGKDSDREEEEPEEIVDIRYDSEVEDVIEDEKGLKKVYEKTLNTFASLELTKLVDLMPDEIRKEARKDRDSMDSLKDMEEEVRESRTEILSARATGIEEIDSGILRQIVRNFENQFDSEIDIDGSCSIRTEIKLEEDGEKDTVTACFEFIKIDGKWYLFTVDD